MKRYIIFIAVAVAALCSCEKEMIAPEFGEVHAENYSDSAGVWLTGEKQTFDVEVKGEDWFVTTPTTDTWIIAYEKNGKLQVKVSANEGDAERVSHVDLRGAGTSVRLTVRQDFIKYLDFAVADNLIDAADGEYDIPVRTNLMTKDLVVTTKADWLSDFSVSDGKLRLVAQANPSETESRSDSLFIESGLFKASAVVTQVPMSGLPYVIKVDTLDFATYPVYDMLDEQNGQHVARVAREYLYKYDYNVDSTYTVVYPVLDGEVNYSKGIVVENGGTVVWTSDININVPGSDMLAHYAAGELSAPAAEVYVPRGATAARIKPLSDADSRIAVHAVPVPLILKDVRSAAGKPDEVCEYAVVKIGGQYWTKSDLRTLRFNDGTEIPYPAFRYITDGTGSWEENLTANVLKPMVLKMNGSTRYFGDQAEVNTVTDFVCAYTFPTVVGAHNGLDFSGMTSVSVPQNDALAPEGWEVPSESDFSLMINYLVQQKHLTSAEKQKILTRTICASGDDLTGFSASGYAVAANGGYRDKKIYYMTKDYVFAASTHSVPMLYLIDGNYVPLFNESAKGGGYHVRLVMKNEK